MKPSLPALLAYACAALASCASSSYQIAFDLLPAQRAVVVVDGQEPAIEVRNEGPGAVEVAIESESECMTYRETSVLERGMIGHTLAGPIRITLETAGTEAARVLLSARGADGLRLDQVRSAEEQPSTPRLVESATGEARLLAGNEPRNAHSLQTRTSSMPLPDTMRVSKPFARR